MVRLFSSPELSLSQLPAATKEGWRSERGGAYCRDPHNTLCVVTRKLFLVDASVYIQQNRVSYEGNIERVHDLSDYDELVRL